MKKNVSEILRIQSTKNKSQKYLQLALYKMVDIRVTVQTFKATYHVSVLSFSGE